MLKLFDSLFYFFVAVANVQELKINSQKCVGINSETATINLKVRKKSHKMKNLFVGLLMFAGTLFAVANNGDTNEKFKGQENVIVTVEESKIINNLDDDTCSITIITTTTVTDCDGTTVHVSSQTGTGTTCAEAEADARSTN